MSLSGVVKQFDSDKGFGFILFNSKDVMFVHRVDVTGGSLQPGDKVCFDQGWNDRNNKPKAINVTGGTGPQGNPWGKVGAWARSRASTEGSLLEVLEKKLLALEETVRLQHKRIEVLEHEVSQRFRSEVPAVTSRSGHHRFEARDPSVATVGRPCSGALERGVGGENVFAHVEVEDIGNHVTFGSKLNC